MGSPFLDFFSKILWDLRQIITIININLQRLYTVGYKQCVGNYLAIIGERLGVKKPRDSTGNTASIESR